MTTTAAGPVTRAAYAWTRNQAGSVLSEQTTITGDPMGRVHRVILRSGGTVR